VVRRRMVGGRGNLRAGIVAVTRPGVHLVRRGHGGDAAMLHGCMCARQHACRSDALEGNRQQQQPHERAAQADMDG